MEINKNINQSKVMVSICLLSYNHEHLIGEVIDSIFKQTFTNYELIISDNCSTDNSWQIIKDYATRYPNIKAVKTPSNIGMGGNMNFVARFAKGEYLAFLHHDDILDKRLIEKWVNVAEKDKNIAFVFNEYLCNGVPGHKKEGRVFNEKMDGKTFLKKHLFWQAPVRGTALVRRDCYDTVGGTELRFDLLADVDLWMKLSARWDVGYVNEPLIEVFQQRPSDYPKEYSEFSWKRKKIFFDMQANNINRELFDNILIFIFYWLNFKFKVSLEIIKWLIYAVVKGRKDIILSSDEGKNAYEVYGVKIIRRIIILCNKLV